MKKENYFSRAIIAIVMTLFVGLNTLAHDFEVDGIYYDITSSTDKTVAVIYCGSSYSAVANEYTGSVVIPETVTNSGTTYSVTSIGNSAFCDCTGLTSVTIPNSVTLIGDDAFYWCTGLTSVTIPNSVTLIGDDAFYWCTGLTSVTIPNSVTSIGDYAFYGCKGLTSVTIPNSVTSIGNWAFSYCSGLTSIKVESGNAVYDSRDNCNAIIETASNTLVLGCKNTTTPNSVTSIGYRAFYGCTGLISTTIPNSVTSIGSSAFYDCTGLISITIPNSVTSIGYSAFCDCTGLTSITSLNPEPPICEETSFRRVPTDCILYVPAGSKEAYANDRYWSYFTNIVELPEAGVDNIEAKQATEVARYDLHGRLLTDPTPGINVVIYSDGTTRKEFVK